MPIMSKLSSIFAVLVLASAAAFANEAILVKSDQNNSRGGNVGEPVNFLTVAQASQDDSVTLTPEQFEKLKNSIRERVQNRANASGKADIEVKTNCTAIFAACAGAAAAVCIFECTPPSEYPGSPNCNSCVDTVADQCAADAGCL